MDTASEHLLAKHPEFLADAPGRARIEGQQALAKAARATEPGRSAKAVAVLRHDWKQPRAYLGLVASTGLIGPQTVLKLAQLRGKGFSWHRRLRAWPLTTRRPTGSAPCSPSPPTNPPLTPPGPDPTAGPCCRRPCPAHGYSCSTLVPPPAACSTATRAWAAPADDWPQPCSAPGSCLPGLGGRIRSDPSPFVAWLAAWLVQDPADVVAGLTIGPPPTQPQGRGATGAPRRCHRCLGQGVLLTPHRPVGDERGHRLRLVADQRPDGLVVPTVLAEQRWHGAQVLVTEPLPDERPTAPSWPTPRWCGPWPA